jgi:tRNA (guanine-N7-)-methyltransferase
MRMRRKPWVRQELAECEFFIDDPTKILGKWHKQFKKKQPIHLELGCGKGTFIAQISSKNQNINYIGIDIKSEVLGLAKRNIEKEFLAKEIPIDNVLLTAYEIEIIRKYIKRKR